LNDPEQPFALPGWRTGSVPKLAMGLCYDVERNVTTLSVLSASRGLGRPMP